MATGAKAAPPRRSQQQLTTLNNSPNVGRFAVTNHFQSTVAALAPASTHPALMAFLPKNLGPWVGKYLKNTFTPRYPFPDYSGSHKNGVYAIAPRAGATNVRIAIAGDWATGTEEAEQIMNLMVAIRPDFTIHLGDVYYVGDEAEVEENCLGRQTGQFAGVQWRPGTQGSFALNGNHEMYANGKAYFKTFLKVLGMAGDQEGQVASFLSLETEHWRVLGLDTGYNSTGIPILSMIPGIKSIPAIGGDCHLEKKTLDWLRGQVQPKARPKATLLLSHHQYFTAFADHTYPKPAKQLMEFFADQEVVWIWGHEHRIGIYGRHSANGGITVYGRCAGHGGMPVDLGVPDGRKAPLQLYDPRSHLLPGGAPVGENGFVMATIQDQTLTLEYRDIHSNQLLVEEFTPGANGALIRRLVSEAGILKPPITTSTGK
jgi:predicted phosphodiesterase